MRWALKRRGGGLNVSINRACSLTPPINTRSSNSEGDVTVKGGDFSQFRVILTRGENPVQDSESEYPNSDSLEYSSSESSVHYTC